MGKKKVFVDKKTAKRYRLLPTLGNPSAPTEGKKFVPTQEQLDEQHKYGVYFDDDYDYLQHMKNVKEGFKLQAVGVEEEEESVIIKAPKMPMPIPSMLFGQGSSVPARQPREVFDEDIQRALEGDLEVFEDDGLDDDFVAMAGGAVPGEMLIREKRDSDEETDEDDDDDYDGNFENYDDDLEDDNEERTVQVHREGPRRDVDTAFDHLLEAAYNDDQMGELDGDDEDVAGMLEPEDGRLHKLLSDKPKLPPTDEESEQMNKDYIKKRMALIEAGVIKEDDDTEYVEVEESASKRMKWDCESFATQYSNVYNHPTLIKDAGAGGLSRKALKRLDRETKQQEAMEEDIEEESDDESIGTTVSTFRPKGETPEERKLRKQAVKEARRNRREEKKANKTAFTDEFRKAKTSRFGQIKSKTIV